MSVPSEIRKLLGGRDVKAHAALSCSFSGPIGETHFVVADGQLFVFERESLIGDFRAVDLDPAHKPKLERGSFNDTLFVALADGAVHELNVSSFERDSIEQVLLENAATPEAQPAEIEKPTVFNTDAHFETGNAPVPEPVGPAKPVIERQSTPSARRELPEQPTEKERAEEEDKQLGREVSIYCGSDPGCIGCLTQFLLFAGAIVAFWYLHIEAAQTLGIVPEGTVEDDSFSFIATKILAVIAGGYFGGRLAGLFGKLFRMLNWTGRVVFSQSTIQVIAPRAKWLLLISTPLEFSISVESFTEAEETHDGQDRLHKRGFNYYLNIEQNGQQATLKTSHPTAQALIDFAGLPVKPAEAKPSEERCITFDYKTLKHIARRLAKSQR